MRYALQQFLRLLLVFFIVTFLVMVFIRMGLRDPAATLLGYPEGQAPPEDVVQVTEQYHLDDPIPVQWAYWVANGATGDFGFSETYDRSVGEQISDKIGITILLGVYAILLGVAIAIPFGVWSAYRRDGTVDKFGAVATFAIISMGSLVLAVLLRFLFAGGLSWLDWFDNTSEKIWPWDDPVGHAKAMTLPTLALGLPIAATLTRLLRADLALTLQSDFVMLAQAKGMSPRRVLVRHALRNSLIPVITAIGLQLGGILGGSVAVEQMFALNGMGFMFVDAVARRDFLVIQGAAALFVLLVVLVNFLVDMLYAVVDPRIKAARSLR
jgi:peptide/nickel transport system permease protein